MLIHVIFNYFSLEKMVTKKEKKKKIESILLIEKNKIKTMVVRREIESTN